MQFEGAVIKEQGITFAVVVVKPHIINSSTDSENTRRGFSRYFPQIPVVLMAQDSRGTPTYSGRKDIVSFLSKVHPARIPWKKYTV